MPSLVRIITLLIHYASRILYHVTYPIFRWLYEDSRRNLPPVSDPILMKSAVQLSKMIRSKQVTSVQVVKACIDRMRAVNHLVNAVVAERFEEALNEAREVDKILNSDVIPEEYSVDNKPFLGVPVTTKEAISIKGLPNSSGLLARAKVLSESDADAITCMRKAGAIPLAVSNVSELCMWYESNNLVYGRTNNCYHQGRMVGGSSGGEGCLQSTGGSPMGIGSDIGGSIRMPAFFNGVFGHKATTGVVSNDGQYPIATAGAKEYMITGPMCRYAEDLLPMFKLLALEKHKQKLRLDEQVDVKKLRYFYMEDDGGGLAMSPVHPEMKESIRKAVKHFESLGCTVQKINLPNMRYSLQIWQTLMTTSGDISFCELLSNGGRPVNPFIELFYFLIGQKRHTFPAIGLGIVEKLKNTDKSEQKTRKRREELIEQFNSILKDDAVFFYPTHPIPAPYHNQPLVVLANFAYTGIFNVLGLPATAVPMGLAQEEGVPLGLQVVGSHYSDRLCLAVAAELEKAFGGWVPPFQVLEN